MHLCPIFKGFHGLCFKCLNCYSLMFATTENFMYSTEASTSAQRVAHAAGKESCPQLPWCMVAMVCLAKPLGGPWDAQ